MITKTAQRLVDIEYEIGATWLQVHTGQISHQEGNETLQGLEDEKERLWALDRSPGV